MPTQQQIEDDTAINPVASARTAGLRYVNDRRPGITRKRWGRGFTYLDAKGRRVTDPKELERIKAIVIPPAWTDVWISPSPKGHIQATGRDEKGRKQYRYHPRWREVRDESKYNRMIEFGHALPAIRTHVDRDMRAHSLSKGRVLATLVRLLETTYIRIGNEEYARENNSFGLTTLRCRHIKVRGSKLRFRFKGKSGKRHTIEVNDARLARVVKRCQELPGQELFGYLDEEGEQHTIHSDDVNEYLYEITGKHFTAKDFRTWGGTVLAATALQRMGMALSAAKARKNVVAAVKEVAERLGNTPAICRKSYIHPFVPASYMTCSQHALLADAEESVVEVDGEQEQSYALKPEERAVLRLLEAGAKG